MGPVAVEPSFPPQRAAGRGGQTSAEDEGIEHLTKLLLSHLHHVFRRHAGPDQRWTPEQAVAFRQHIQATDDPATEVAAEAQMDFHDFLGYMTSPAANALQPPAREDMDMTWPLSNYFVSSSHSTYRAGDQLPGTAPGTDVYKNVLLRACRCIEIDVRDGEWLVREGIDDDVMFGDKRASRRSQIGMKAARWASDKWQPQDARASCDLSPNRKSLAENRKSLAENRKSLAGNRKSMTGSFAFEPKVIQGRNPTRDVLFRDVCETVRTYAFAVTDLPLIVSLDVHCSPLQQERMVDIMNEAWDGLLLPPSGTDPDVLPSPAELKNKILVKVKHAAPHDGLTPTSTSSSDTDSMASLLGEGEGKARRPQIIPALSELGVYTRGFSFKSLSEPEAASPTHVFSLSEAELTKVHEEHARDLFRHNRHFMMRAYPAKSRVGASNLNPMNFWRKGVQIVAMNWTSWDDGMMLNEGMFAGTGGYVLKPDGYRAARASHPADEDAEQRIPSHQTLWRLAVHMLAAQHLPLPSAADEPAHMRPYVTMQVHTEPHLYEELRRKKQANYAPRGEFKSRTKTRQGVHPDFQGEVLKFQNIDGVVPEMSLVTFQVWHDEIGRGRPMAWACIRLDRLRSGYRYIRLMDKDGLVSRGIILVRVEKRLW